ncbi:carbon-nitrogen hydrolase family protein [Alphaproteobacteria bacterium]|nr:carbon-nitrogen hydrolase family protein [Alphaproteobacteria bacterium]
MRVALIQMTSVPDLDVNIKSILNGIRKAKEYKADIVLFPENCAFMGRGSETLATATEESKHPALLAAREAALKYSIYVLLGSIAVYPSKNIKNKLANRSLFIDNLGRICGRYDKINMFDATLSEKESYKESDRYIAGSEIVTVENELGKIGLTICYDIRFPKLYSKLLDKGCNIITIPSAFTKNTGKDHWEVLIRSRAIETCSWVLAPAQIGIHYEKRETWGHSMVVDPWGKILAEAKNNEDIILADIDINKSDIVKKVWGKL